MVKLPDKTDLGTRLPSAQGMIPNFGNTGQVGRALQGLGNSVANVGAAVGDFQREQMAAARETEEFGVQNRLLQFEQNWRDTVTERQQSAQPGAANFVEGIRADYTKQAREFLSTVPDYLKPKYDQKLLGLQSRLVDAGQSFERQETRRYAGVQIDESQSRLLNRQTEDPSTWQSVEEEGVAIIRNAPGLSPIEKEEKIREWRAQRAMAHRDARIARGEYGELEAEIGISSSYMAKVEHVESSGNPNAKAATSSATGLHQFTKGTWLDIARKYEPEMFDVMSDGEILALRTDPNVSRRMFEHLTNENRKALERVGAPVTDGTLYLAHFAGSGGAAKLLTADPNASVESVLGKAAVNANAFLKGKTAAEVIAWADKKMGSAPSVTAVSPVYANLPPEERIKTIKQLENVNTVERQRYVQGAQDYASYLQAGNAPTGAYQPQEVIARLGEEDGQQVVEQIERAEIFGGKVARVKWASPAEIQEIVQTEQARLGSPQDFEQNQKEVTALFRAINERNTALAEDPARFVAENPEVAETYDNMAAVLSNPTATPEDHTTATKAYADATLAVQDRLGVPPEAQRVLTKDQARQMAAQFKRQPEGGQNAAVLMQGMAEQWGAYWPQVFNDMGEDLPGTALVIGMMEGEDQRLAAEKVAEASLVGAKALKESLPGDKTKDLNDNLLAEMADFQGTLSMIPGGSRTFNVVKEGVELLTLQYMAEGESQPNAISRAYNDIVGKRYTIEGTYRVPVERDAYAVRDGASAYLERLDGIDGLDLPFDNYGLTDEEVREEYVASLQEFGFWVTAPDESGLMLYRDDQKAVTVRGQPLVVPWGDLEATGVEAVGAAALEAAGSAPLGLPTGRAVQMPEIEVIMPPGYE